MPKICQIQNNCSAKMLWYVWSKYIEKRWAADLLCCLFIWLYVFQLLTNNDEVGVQSTIYVRSRRKSAMLSERSFVLLCVLWYRRRQRRGGTDRQTADCSGPDCLRHPFPDGKPGRSFFPPVDNFFLCA